MEKENPKSYSKPAPGDGLRSLRSTMMFRAINFELYTKPNKAIMAFGLFTMISCMSYMFYMNLKHDGSEYYTAIDTSGELISKKKISRWES